MKKTLLSLPIIILLSTSAAAQVSLGNSDDPILVDAETATYKGALTTLEGNVDVRQGTTRITADLMEIYREELGGNGQSSVTLGDVQKIVATGNFQYTAPDSMVTGSKGVYERDNGTITVTGDVKFKQSGGSVVSGKKLVYDIERRQAKFGESCAGQNCNQQGRVSFTIKN